MLDGKDVVLTDAQIEETENVLSYQFALNKIFDRIVKESAEWQHKERRMWYKLEKIAKEQFPEYDTKKHILTYSWDRMKLSIKSREEDEFGID